MHCVVTKSLRYYEILNACGVFCVKWPVSEYTNCEEVFRFHFGVMFTPYCVICNFLAVKKSPIIHGSLGYIVIITT